MILTTDCFSRQSKTRQPACVWWLYLPTSTSTLSNIEDYHQRLRRHRPHQEYIKVPLNALPSWVDRIPWRRSHLRLSNYSVYSTETVVLKIAILSCIAWKAQCSDIRSTLMLVSPMHLGIANNRTPYFVRMHTGCKPSSWIHSLGVLTV